MNAREKQEKELEEIELIHFFPENITKESIRLAKIFESFHLGRIQMHMKLGKTYKEAEIEAAKEFEEQLDKNNKLLDK